MFTGIVEETGRVEKIQSTGTAIELTVHARICAGGLKIGDSVAVNGCCLTAVKISSQRGRKLVRFDLLKETWTRTNLQFVQVGSSVNLERSLRADGRLDGHFVTGHIDGTGKIKVWEQRGADWFLEIAPGTDVLRYMVFKGAVAVDGISLTVAEVRKKSFCVWIIPHTHQVTALRERRVGELVNLEADILGKYVEQFIGRRTTK